MTPITGEGPLLDLLRALQDAGASPCGASVLWAEEMPTGTTVEAAWGACGRGDWMLWLVPHLFDEETMPAALLRALTLAAADCAEIVVPAMPDADAAAYETRGESIARAEEVLRVVRAWANGEASWDQVWEAGVLFRGDLGNMNLPEDDTLSIAAWHLEAFGQEVALVVDDLHEAACIDYLTNAQIARTAEIVRERVPWALVAPHVEDFMAQHGGAS